MPKPVSNANLLIIGTDRYAQETLLPAVYCLAGEFEWVGLAGSEPEQRNYLAARWENCTVVDRLDACDWPAIDIVALAEPLERVPAVLQELAQYPVAKTILLLEPPILPRDRLQACQYFPAFQAVCAAADCLAWPNLRVARELIAAGKIGTPQKLWLQNSSDRRDATTIARSFAAGAPVSFARAETFGPNDCHEYHLQFPRGFRANILEPYDAEVGRFAIIGTAGAIVDYPLYTPNTIQIGYAFEGVRFRGITVDGDLQPIDARDWAFLDRLPYGHLPNTSLQGLLKIRGLMEVIHSLWSRDPAYSYSWRDALYDAMLPQASIWWDPLAPAGHSLLQAFYSRWLPPAQRALRALKRS
ncbi:MAG: hypothetical protein AAFY11_14970 [Cyanobacteria bacterium J06641_5]